MGTAVGKKKVTAVVFAILETFFFLFCFAYVTANIKSVSSEQFKNWTQYGAKNDFLVWMACLTSTLTLVSFLQVIGSIKDNFWLMIPSVGLHFAALIFFFIVTLTGIIRTSCDPMGAWMISEIGIFLIVLTALLFGGIGIYFGILVRDQVNVEKKEKKIVLTPSLTSADPIIL